MNMYEGEQLICSNCSSLNIHDIGKQYLCKSCGAKIMKISNEDILDEIKKGRELRNSCNFEEASKFFKHLLKQHEWDRETQKDILSNIHLELFLCDNGVIYEMDGENSDVSIPVLYALNYKNDLENQFYKDIMAYDPDNKAFYDKVFSDIKSYKKSYQSFVRKNAPYDIFICYHELSGGGQAKQIYQKIKSSFPDLKIFYAKETIKLDDFGPHIHYAIDTASMLIVVSAGAHELDESVWVRHEIKRFTNRKENEFNRDLVVLPIYTGSLETAVPYKLRLLKQCTEYWEEKTWLTQIQVFFDQLKNRSTLEISIPELVISGKTENHEKVPHEKDQQDSFIKDYNVKTITSLKQQALDGNIEAQLSIAKAFYHGQNGYEQSYAKSLTWFELASKQSAEANFYLGNMYFKGLGVEVSDTNAIHHYTIAAEQGHLEAIKNLAWFYLEGKGIEKDVQKAITLLKPIAVQNDIWSAVRLGDIYHHNNSDIQDNELAFKYYEIAANLGDGEAKYELYNFYMQGIYVEVNQDKALDLLIQSANLGYPPALYCLGEVYEYGNTVEPDIDKALHYYNLAAEQENVEALAKLGYLYEIGEKVQQDYAKAKTFYQRASNLNDCVSQFNLALMYMYSKGVDQNYTEAYRWLLKSANQGDTNAEYMLGQYFRDGLNGKPNFQKAVDWFRKAAKKDHIEAQMCLAELYLKGQGVAESKNKAIEWYRHAEKLGSEEARIKIIEINNENTNQSVEGNTTNQSAETETQPSYNSYDNSNKKNAAIWISIIISILLVVNAIIYAIFGEQYLNTAIFITIPLVALYAIPISLTYDDLGSETIISIMGFLLAHVLIFFSLGINWIFWQWTISYVVLAILIMLLLMFVETDEVEAGAILVVGGIVNIILFIIFKDNYSVLFYNLAVVMLAVGLVYIIYLINDAEEDAGIGYAIYYIISLIIQVITYLLILNLWIVNPWILWQIGISIIVIAITTGIYFASEEVMVNGYLAVTLMLISAILFIIFKFNYQWIAIITGLFLIASMVVFIIQAFDDYEGASALFFMVVTVIYLTMGLKELNILPYYPWEYFNITITFPSINWDFKLNGFWQIIISVAVIIISLIIYSNIYDSFENAVFVAIMMVISTILLNIFSDNYQWIAIVLGIFFLLSMAIFIIGMFINLDIMASFIFAILSLVFIFVGFIDFNFFTMLPIQFKTLGFSSAIKHFELLRYTL